MRAGLLALALLLLPLSARAEEWGSINAGVTTLDQVRERFGNPTRESQPKVEGFDTKEWVYEGAQAPAGLVRMTVSFGLLTPGGYRPSVVRLLKLEPKPNLFGRNTVIDGWGVPDGVGSQDGVDTFFYKSGLFVLFDKEGTSATSMVFGPPQPDAPPGNAAGSPKK